MIDVCADCGCDMGAFACPICGGIGSAITLDELDDVAAMKLLAKAKVLIEEGARIIEVQEVRIVVLEHRVARLRHSLLGTSPPDAA